MRKSVGGPIFGWIFAIFAAFLLSRVTHHTAVEVTGTVLASYACYLLSTSYIGASGVLSLVIFGICMGKWRHGSVSPTVQVALYQVWSWLVFIANTLLFIICGVICCRGLFLNSDISGQDFGYCILLWCILQLTRFVAVALSLPLSRLFGYTLSWREIIMMSAAGLRGAISLFLALLTALEPGLDPAVTSKIVFHTSGIVLLTNIVNGCASKWLVRALRLSEEALEDRLLMEEAMRQLQLRLEAEAQRMKTEEVYAFLDVEETLASCWRRASAALSPLPVSSSQWETALTVRCLNALKLEYERLYQQSLLSISALDQMTAACDAGVDRAQFSVFVSAIERALRLSWWQVWLYESRLTARVPLLLRLVEGMLQSHHQRGMEVVTSVAHSLSLCYQVIDAFASLSCVDQQMRERVAQAVSDYHRSMLQRVADMRAAFPAAARELQQLRAFLSLSVFQQREAVNLKFSGLLTGTQWKQVDLGIDLKSQERERKRPALGYEQSSLHVLESSPLLAGTEGVERERKKRKGRWRAVQAGSVMSRAGVDVDGISLIIRGLVTVDHRQLHGHSLTRNRFASLVTTSVHPVQSNAVLISPLEFDGLMSSQPSASSFPPSPRIGSTRPLITKRSTGDMVGVYAAMTGRPALITCTAVTTVEAFFLPISALLPAAGSAAGSSSHLEALWRKAAADVILSCFQSQLRGPLLSSTPATPSHASDTVLVQRIVESARLLSASELPFLWSPRRHRALLLLHGTLAMAVTAEQRVTLHAPAWVEPSAREEKAGAVVHMHAARGAQLLMWFDSAAEDEEGQDDAALLQRESDSAEAAMLMVPVTAVATVASEGSADSADEDAVLIDVQRRRRQDERVALPEVELVAMQAEQAGEEEAAAEAANEAAAAAMISILSSDHKTTPPRTPHSPRALALPPVQPLQ